MRELSVREAGLGCILGDMFGRKACLLCVGLLIDLVLGEGDLGSLAGDLALVVELTVEPAMCRKMAIYAAIVAVASATGVHGVLEELFLVGMRTIAFVYELAEV